MQVRHHNFRESMKRAWKSYESTRESKWTERALANEQSDETWVSDRSRVTLSLRTLYIHIIYTPNLGLEIAVFDREREQSRFRESSEKTRESSEEAEERNKRKEILTSRWTWIDCISLGYSCSCYLHSLLLPKLLQFRSLLTSSCFWNAFWRKSIIEDYWAVSSTSISLALYHTVIITQLILIS